MSDSTPVGSPWPKISIVTPSYNQGAFIEKTIRSILLQGYPDIEYIIIDGGSTDDSTRIIKKYEKWLAYWVSERDRGQSHAINKGFDKAVGHVFTWLNSDDYLLENAFSSVATAWISDPEAGGWIGGCLQVNPQGRTLREVRPNRLSVDDLAESGENSLPQPACFFSAAGWRKCGSLDETLHYAMDFDLWLRVAKEFPMRKVDEVIAAAVVHEGAKTQASAGHMFAEIYLVQIRHGYGTLAVREISRWIDDCMAQGRAIDRVRRFPLFRPLVPLGRMVWKRLGRR